MNNFFSHYAASILDVLQDGIFISDPAGKTLHINRMYEQLTGLVKENILGKNVRSLVDEGVFDKVLNPEIVRTGKSATHVQHLKNGKKLVLSGFPVFDNKGNLCLVVTFARDITRLTHLQYQISNQRQLIDQISGQLAYMVQEQRVKVPVFASPVMKETVALLKRFAETDATVLILGETGVGKDVFAHYLHDLSSRKDKVMLKVDCGGISENLIESELFGYSAGAFTGASRNGKAGYFEIADNGTIFLDEIGELPLAMQTRLLRVLQDGEIARVGDSTPRKVNVRIIAATNRNLAENVEAGTFRRDLYYRLNVANLYIPSLRERPEDIKPLAEHFLKQYASTYHKSIAFMNITLDLLGDYVWPGNVRELQNVIHSLVITLNGPLIAPSDLPAHITGKKQGNSGYSDEILNSAKPYKDIMAEIERDFLLKAIEAHGSIQNVAKRFHINRSTIFRKLKKCP